MSYNFIQKLRLSSILLYLVTINKFVHSITGAYFDSLLSCMGCQQMKQQEAIWLSQSKRKKNKTSVTKKLLGIYFICYSDDFKCNCRVSSVCLLVWSLFSGSFSAAFRRLLPSIDGVGCFAALITFVLKAEYFYSILEDVPAPKSTTILIHLLMIAFPYKSQPQHEKITL